MILDLLDQGYAEPITLVHGVRTEADLYGRAEFEALAAKHSNFRYSPALSNEPEGSVWAGERGFVHDVANASTTASSLATPHISAVHRQ